MIKGSQHSRDIREGFRFWMSGWAFIFRNRGLLKYTIIPFLISALWAASSVYFIFVQLPLGIQKIMESWAWLPDLFYYPVLITIGLLLFVLNIYFSYLLVSLVAIPFNAVLAEKALGILDKRPAPFQSWKERILHSLRMLMVGIIKLLLLIIIGIFLFVLSYIPGLNILTLSCALLLLAFDCLDYSLDCFGLSFRARIKYYSRNLPQCFGMAAGLALTLLVPGLTLLIIPGAVVGAAIIVKSEKL